MSDISEHFEWEERLQDRIDGDLDPAHCIALDEHIASCALCRAQMGVLQSIDTTLAAIHLNEKPDESFDRTVFERIAATERADRAAARARLEQEWRAQLAALSHQWRDTWKSILLNGLAVTALLVALSRTFDSLPYIHYLLDQAGLLTQYAAARPLVTLPVAAGLTAAALWLVRALASRSD